MVQHVLCVGGEDHGLRIPFLAALRERGFRITAASTADGAAFQRAGLAHRSYQFDRFDSRGADLAAIRQLARLIAETGPDLVQSFDTKPNLLAPLAARGKVAVVRTINGMGWVFSSDAARALALRPVYCALQWAVSRWSAATVFQNRDDKAFFERHHLVRPARAHLIRGSGLDIAGFERSRAAIPAAAAALRQQLGLGTGDVVVTVSRLTRQKGIPTLLEAASLVKAQRPDVRFLLVGSRESEGPFAVTQDEIDRQAPHVMALGARSDVPVLLGLADLFVLPTEYREGLPRVLLEAGLAGLPIVATAMPGCSDVVTDGSNGFLVPPRDAGALAARILDVLADRRTARAMGNRSAELVRREFGLTSIVGQYADLYRQVLSRQGSRGEAAGPSRPPALDRAGALRGIGESE
jgi:glycosyltransferase involved in cell wall biosynthesis